MAGLEEGQHRASIHYNAPIDSTGGCLTDAVGSVWNPEGNPTYGEYDPNKLKNRFRGNLGLLDQTSDDVCAPVTRQVCDTKIKLWGNKGIEGRSVVVNQYIGNSANIACGAIREARAKPDEWI